VAERSHRLKTHESAFLEVRSGRKKAEFRRNDRDFMVGDVVYLDRWRPGYYRHGIGDGGAYVNANGFAASGVGEGDMDVIVVRITHIQTGFGIPDGFCMFSFETIRAQDLATSQQQQRLP
jgi:hypothetical protein